MRFNIGVICSNGMPKTVGYIDADSKEDAVEKLGLYPSGASPTGLTIPVDDRRFIVVSLFESKSVEITDKNQLKGVIKNIDSLQNHLVFVR